PRHADREVDGMSHPPAPGSDLALMFAVRGSLTTLQPADRRALFDRATSSDPTVRTRTTAIIDRVRAEGDTALLSYAREFDGATLTRLEIPRTEWEAALAALEPALRRALERAAANIRTVH